MQPGGYGAAINHITLEHITLRGWMGRCADGCVHGGIVATTQIQLQSGRCLAGRAVGRHNGRQLARCRWL